MSTTLPSHNSANRTASQITGNTNWSNQGVGLAGSGQLAGGLASNCCYPNQWQGYGYPTYYWYGVSDKPKLADVIAEYKKAFGKDWKRIFAETVKVEAR